MTKADQSLATPTASSKTSTSVTLNTITGQGDVKYACVQGDNATAPADDSDKWKDSTEFTGLQPATAYTFFARCAGNDYYNEATSSGTVIYTNYAVTTDIDFASGSEPRTALGSWDKVEGATSYIVKLYKQGNEQPLTEKEVSAIHDLNKQNCIFDITSAGTYSFTVKATNEGIDGDVATSKSLTFYEVKFDSMGGSTVSPVYAVKDSNLSKPANPEKENFTFGGWYQDSNCTNPWYFTDVNNPSAVPEGGVTLYAKWLSTNAGVDSVTVNGQSATAGENNTFSVTLPYGSSLPTESSAITISAADKATVSDLTTNNNGATWTFTVTAEDNVTTEQYTINVSIGPDPAAENKAAVDAAKTAIEDADWTVPQATANTEEAVKAWIERQLAGLAEIDQNGVSYSVTMTGFTAAVEGTAEDRNGTNGSFAFTVKLSKGENTGDMATSTYAEATATVTGGVITATPYNMWTVTVTAGNGGAVTGGGTYENGSTVTVTATPSGSRYYFIRWTENGTEVSTDASYTFTLTADRNLTAEFGRRSSGGSSSSSSRDEGPSTGDSDGWKDIQDEVAAADSGETITIDMGDETEVPAQVFEEVAGKDVTVEFDMGDVTWTVNGEDIPTGTDLSSLDLGVDLGTSGISVDVINTVTGELGSVQITLAHSGEFGFALTLTAPLGKEKAGYWANLYHYDEDAKALNYETSARIDEDGNTALRMTHASQYAIVIDEKSHDLPFEDVNEGAWYESAVRYAYTHGIMSGYGDKLFGPDDDLSRAQLCQIVYNMEGQPTVSGGSVFTDVADGAWYADAVSWAASQGIVGGYGDGVFGPEDNITREQLAAILYRYAQNKGYDVSVGEDTNILSYTDAMEISEYAIPAMQWACGAGVIEGVTESTLEPQGNATRAQVATMLMRFCERYEEI